MEQETRSDGPAVRLLRLWLWAAPLGMLALAVLFGVLAVDEGNWGLLAAMVVLALVVRVVASAVAPATSRYDCEHGR